MASSRSEEISLDEFRRIVERAGLDLSAEELEALKPLHDLYAVHLALVHSVDLKSEELGVTFQAEWD